MNDEQKSKVWAWFEKLTFKRLAISVLALTAGLFLYTTWENRQKIFDKVEQLPVSNNDFVIVEPTAEQSALVNKFLLLHPEVKFITLIDADPVTNRRQVVSRFSLDKMILDYIQKLVKERPGHDDGPLFTDNQPNNEQVLAVSNGEFKCVSADAVMLERFYPEIAKDIKTTCRVPVPPAFRKAGGWFSLHLTVEAEESQLKTDALTMSFLYFEFKK